jgi:cholesterol oxidase
MSVRRESRLSQPLADLRASYDAIVVGSGYGGGVAASRLARMGLKVCVLERGREMQAGDFPRTLDEVRRATQIATAKGRLGDPRALFDLRMGQGAHALVGAGVGGTSLINANVCLLPEPRVLADEAWPTELRVDHHLDVGFGRARDMLRPRATPAQIKPTKLAALGVAAHGLGSDIERVPVHIAFEAGPSAAGAAQPACTLCGDCMTGCNVGAKTTVANTYLLDAANHGAAIFAEIAVQYLERRDDGRWRVVVDLKNDQGRDVPIRAITAHLVILAAGSFGSTEILLRSKARGLAVSDRLGERVSSNADAISFAVGTKQRVAATGVGHPPRHGRTPPGPAVTGLIDLRRRGDLSESLAIVEASTPSALAPLFRLLTTTQGLSGSADGANAAALLDDAQARLETLFAGVYEGVSRDTQTYLTIGHDRPDGRIVLAGNGAVFSWPDAADDPAYDVAAEALRKATEATGGIHVPNPLASRLFGHAMLTVHPLGGCAMGEDRAHGVVDHKGRVFDASQAVGTTDVHDGLYVCDGSVVPRALGIHPLMTITAIAERTMILLARDLERRLDVTPRPAQAAVTQGPQRASAPVARRSWFGRRSEANA